MIEDYIYNELIHPRNLFKSVEDLKEFIKIYDEDLLSEYWDGLSVMLKLCEDDELYEYCAIIKKKLDERP
jgi:hypothetical protein